MKNTRRSSLVLVLLSGLLLWGAPALTTAQSTVTPVPREGWTYERYEMLNERVQAHEGELDLLFVGDSITQGWEGAGSEIWDEFYGDRALNIGISGDRTEHVLWRLENGNVDGISPRATVVMIGTNNSGPNRDTTAEILEGVQAVVASLREKLPETKILLLGIFPRSRHFDEQRGQIAQVNQVLPRLEDGENVFYLDFGHVFLNDDGTIPESIMPDALHLSPAGYRLWAESIQPKLEKLLSDEG